MKQTILLCLLGCLYFGFGCSNEPSSNPETSTISNNETHEMVDSVPIFWKTICSYNKFANLFDCNTFDCYQIELINDPFKDFVALTIKIQDSIPDVIYYNRFSSKNSRIKTKNNFVIPVINPITKDTFIYSCSAEIELKIELDPKIEFFFERTIWEIPRKDKMIDMTDSETWLTKGRSSGRAIIVSRYLFQDSIYYSNIQKLLDICKISDYKYDKE
ncbi:MAG: hypothetical protein JNJ57_02635 [Saprospiraceae bacterium]|nr:hypothetical protein [Saprospiraceae bacterium]